MLYHMAVWLIKAGEHLKSIKTFGELERNKLFKLAVRAIRTFE